MYDRQADGLFDGGDNRPLRKCNVLTDSRPVIPFRSADILNV